MHLLALRGHGRDHDTASRTENVLSIPSRCTIPNLIDNVIYREAEIGSAQLTYVDSPNNVSLVSRIYSMTRRVGRRWLTGMTYSRNVARSMVSVLSTSPASPASLMKTSPWAVERRDKGGSARSRALMRDKGR